MTAKKVTYTASQLYTGREVTIQRLGHGPETGKVTGGFQCGGDQMGFMNEDGDEYCVSKSRIISLGR